LGSGRWCPESGFGRGLHTVVSLPPGIFAPYSDVKTVLLFLERPRKAIGKHEERRFCIG
jgi:hypothetical protein